MIRKGSHFYMFIKLVQSNFIYTCISTIYCTLYINLMKMLSWWYGSWIYNYLCNKCLSPLTLWVRIPIMARCTGYNIMCYNLSVTYDRSVFFSLYCGFLHKYTDCHNITVILLAVALNTITLTLNLMAIYWVIVLSYMYYKL